MTTRLTIAQSERALLFREGRFVGILEPGVRWILQPFARIAVQLYDLRVPEFEHPRIDELLAQACAGQAATLLKGSTAIRVEKVRARRTAPDAAATGAQSLAFL